ncbi:MAG: DUF6728 family protein [Salibacteraceae bacterium]
MLFKKIIGYLDITAPFRKSTGNKNFNLRMMHGINRISIFMFLICLIIMLIKFVF